MDKFSRRNVLGLAGAGLMAGAAHAAHAAEAPASWDRECDVLVVGSGYAGLCAAIEARTAGADTLLIEKMVVLGGNSALCGGGIAAPGSDLQKAAGVKDSADQLFGELVAEKISEITQGRLTIDYHPNGDLGGDADLLRQVQCGGIDIVVCQTAPVASFVPEMAVFDLPMVFSQYDGDTIDQVLNDPDSEFFIQLSQAYEEKDLHLLGFLQNGTYRITTANRPLYTLEDYHNLQIRTMENSNHMEFWSAIGANPTPLAFSELYFTLSSGGIDAQENAADSCVGINLQEVQDYLACTNHILYANQIAISKESYDALPAEYQQALEQAVSEAIAEIRPQLTQLDEDSKQIMVDSGMELIEYDDSFFQEILALDSVTALYDQINEDVNGLGTILQEALAEAAAEQAE